MLNPRLWSIALLVVVALLALLVVTGHWLAPRLAGDPVAYRRAGALVVGGACLLGLALALCAVPLMLRGVLAAQQGLGHASFAPVAFALQHEHALVIVLWSWLLFGGGVAAPSVWRDLLNAPDAFPLPPAAAMEYPGEWDRLSASLAACGPDDAQRAWAFLVAEGLVRDADGDRARFAALLDAERARPTGVGASLAWRLAQRLRADGLATPAADAPDPFGALATAHQACAHE